YYNTSAPHSPHHHSKVSTLLSSQFVSHPFHTDSFSENRPLPPCLDAMRTKTREWKRIMERKINLIRFVHETEPPLATTLPVILVQRNFKIETCHRVYIFD